MINVLGKNQSDVIYFIKNEQILDRDQAFKAVEFY